MVAGQAFCAPPSCRIGKYDPACSEVLSEQASTSAVITAHLPDQQLLQQQRGLGELGEVVRGPHFRPQVQKPRHPCRGGPLPGQGSLRNQPLAIVPLLGPYCPSCRLPLMETLQK